MEKNELEIKVTDIIASFLKSIVLIVAITAFFTALLGGYGYYRAKKATVNSAFQEDVDTVRKKSPPKSSRSRILSIRMKRSTKSTSLTIPARSRETVH